MMSDTESDPNAYYDNLNSTNLSYLSPKMSSDLANHLVNLKQKVDIINNGYQLGRKKIENECQQVVSDINRATEQLIKEILNKRDVMINDVELYQRDVLLDYQERYENNQKFESNKCTINSAYNIILDDLTEFNTKKSVSEEDGRVLIEKIELLVSKLNDACGWLIPDPSPSIGIVFTKNNADIQIPFIGDITYDSVNKVDIVAKISYLNNMVQQRVYKIDHIIEDHLFQKHITLISKNKLLVLYEKVYGKVISVFVKIVYYNGSVLHEIEICNVGNLVAYCVYDNCILLDFRKSKNDHILYMYDTNLKYLQDQALNFEVQSLLMHAKTIFVLTEKKPFIREYDDKFKLTKSFGQKSKENSPFYLKGEVVGINDLKIFVKCENELRLISRSSGELLSKVTFDDLKASKICLDYYKEKYIVFNGFDKVSYYNHKGELITCNKLRTGQVFDQFKFSRSGHFAFINHKKNLVLVI
ncbi:hypothetical protein BpHYR1_008928 [Brachionus plicatilis]|uniref:Uncharacterized protein n=1 Tax=Brachionus plicatilis TaxID=10195 RepID=A0A3M7RKK4_BRAPC|nr:hypothetical protein BpHYR1_008928 [Brachionus plicatilis]